MRNLFRAFLFKLRRDLTFRITLFIGIGMAFFMTGTFALIDLLTWLGSEGEFAFNYCNGQNLLVNTLSPASNFGLVIPILLTVFTVSEFNSGTIRNKIIAGNSKSKIYFSIFLSGLVFTFVVIIAYVGLCVGLASILGKFNPNGTIFAINNMSATVNGLLGGTTICPEFVWKIVVVGVTVYITVTAMTVFFSTLFRNMGPCIPIIIVLLLFFSLESMIASIFALDNQLDSVATAIITTSRILNPLYALNSYDVKDISESVHKFTITNTNLLIHICNNVVYSMLFLLGGWLIFRKRDVK